MKKGILACGVFMILASCGNGNTAGNSASEESTSDTANMNMANQSPMGDTANQINNRAGSYPADTSNKNGNDSVKGSSGASRSTTPGNESGHKGRKE